MRVLIDLSRHEFHLVKGRAGELALYEGFSVTLFKSGSAPSAVRLGCCVGFSPKETLAPEPKTDGRRR